MSQRIILIVDDDADIRESLRDAFEDEGYRARCAANGLEALDELRRDPPCAVVIDLIMPLMSGHELYETMKLDPTLSDIPVVISTSDPSRAPRGALLLKKPIDIGTMLDTIDGLWVA